MRKLVTIDYRPRDIFKPYHRRTQRFAVNVGHRRCGKTVACVNDMIRRAVTAKLPHSRYAYVAPLYSQGKEIAWDYLQRFGRPIISEVNVAELRVTLINGASIRIHGADNPDRLRGGYLDGCILDEYGDMRPSVLSDVVRPMLADRLGWLTAIGTPKGRNQFHSLYARALTEPDWYSGCFRASETGILDAAELEAAARDMTPEAYQQEFECSFDASIIGAYYGKEIAESERAGRIRVVKREPGVRVQTAWDLGIGDSMAIWVFQVVGSEIRVLDVYENSGFGFDHYVKELNRRGWGGKEVIDWVPHDAKVRELGTGKSRIEALIELDRFPRLVPNLGVEDGINALRLAFPHIYWDIEHCSEGIEALRQYRTLYDERTKAFANAPRHDWTSHYADAARYMAVAAREFMPKPKPADKPIGVSLDELSHTEFFRLEDRRANERV